MPEIITEKQRQVLEAALKVKELLERAERERLAADTGYADYEQLIGQEGASSELATLAYRRASYHRQAWAACSAEASARMAFAQLTGLA
jgi:hypothetical protein